MIITFHWFSSWTEVKAHVRYSIRQHVRPQYRVDKAQVVVVFEQNTAGHYFYIASIVKMCRCRY